MIYIRLRKCHIQSLLLLMISRSVCPPGVSGVCLDCQDNTQGHNCEECLVNFYRRPGEGSADACLPCSCSSETSSGSCHLGESASLWHVDRVQHIVSWKCLGIIQEGRKMEGIKSSILIYFVTDGSWHLHYQSKLF